MSNKHGFCLTVVISSSLTDWRLVWSTVSCTFFFCHSLRTSCRARMPQKDIWLCVSSSTSATTAALSGGRNKLSLFNLIQWSSLDGISKCLVVKEFYSKKNSGSFSSLIVKRSRSSASLLSMESHSPRAVALTSTRVASRNRQSMRFGCKVDKLLACYRSADIWRQTHRVKSQSQWRRRKMIVANHFTVNRRRSRSTITTNKCSISVSYLASSSSISPQFISALTLTQIFLKTVQEWSIITASFHLFQRTINKDISIRNLNELAATVNHFPLTFPHIFDSEFNWAIGGQTINYEVWGMEAEITFEGNEETYLWFMYLGKRLIDFFCSVCLCDELLNVWIKRDFGEDLS